jgi:hypothetical protein
MTLSTNITTYRAGVANSACHGDGGRNVPPFLTEKTKVEELPPVMQRGPLNDQQRAAAIVRLVSFSPCARQQRRWTPS